MKNFKSLPQLLDYFKDEKTCITYYEKLRWNGRITCPHCGAGNPYKTNRGYKCSDNECYKKFSVKVGTIFEGSKVPFRLWIAAYYLISAHKKGISSLQLATDLGVTQKTSWFMLHRIRTAMANQVPDSFDGNKIVEIDETHVGGKEENRHKNKKRFEGTDLANDGTVYNKKKIVLGMVERGGKIALKTVGSRSEHDILPMITKYAPAGTTIVTDEFSSYSKLKDNYNHTTVNHSANVFVDGETHTNTIENFFSVFKRGIIGIYHNVSEKHLDRYLNEFASRYNSRDMNSFERLESMLKSSQGGLLLKNLIS